MFVFVPGLAVSHLINKSKKNWKITLSKNVKKITRTWEWEASGAQTRRKTKQDRTGIEEVVGLAFYLDYYRAFMCCKFYFLVCHTFWLKHSKKDGHGWDLYKVKSMFESASSPMLESQSHQSDGEWES